MDNHFIPFFSHEYNYNSHAKSLFSKQILSWLYRCRQRRKTEECPWAGSNGLRAKWAHLSLPDSLNALPLCSHLLPKCPPRLQREHLYIPHTEGEILSVSRDQKHSITWKLVGNANPGASPPAPTGETLAGCILTRPQGDSGAVKFGATALRKIK